MKKIQIADLVGMRLIMLRTEWPHGSARFYAG